MRLTEIFSVEENRFSSLKDDLFGDPLGLMKVFSIIGERPTVFITIIRFFKKKGLKVFFDQRVPPSIFGN